MKNIVQMQDDLKNIPDNTLVSYMQNPTSTMQGMLGMYPSYLVLGELQRRKDMRDRYQAQQQGEPSTVAEDLANIAPEDKEGTPAGLEAMMNENSSEGLEGMDLPEDMYNETSYAGGGIVAFAQGGDMPYPQYDRPQTGFGRFFNPIGSSIGRGIDLAKEEAKLRYQLAKNAIMPWESLTNAEILQRKEKSNQIKAQLDEVIKGQNPFGSGGYEYKPGEKAVLSDEEAFKQFQKNRDEAELKKTKDEANKELNKKGSTSTGSTSTGSTSTGPTSSSLMNMVMDTTDEDTLRQQRIQQYKDYMGEDKYAAGLAEALKKQESMIKDAEDKKLGKFFLATGAGMAMSKDPFFTVGLGAGLKEGAAQLSKDEDRLEKLNDKRAQLLSDLSKTERAQKSAEYKYGDDSAQATLLRNQKDKQFSQAQALEKEKMATTERIADKRNDMYRDIYGGKNQDALLKTAMIESNKVNKKLYEDLAYLQSIPNPNDKIKLMMEQIQKQIKDNENKIFAQAGLSSQGGGLAGLSINPNDWTVEDVE